MFGDFLVSKNLISQEQLEEALSVQPMSRKKIGRILVELGFVSQENCDNALAEFFKVKGDNNFLSYISDKSVQSQVQKLELNGLKGYLVVGTPVRLFLNKFSDLIIEMAEKIRGDFEIVLLTDDQWDLMGSLSAAAQPSSLIESMDFTKDAIKTTTSTPYKDLLISLLEKAKDCNASDVHFDSTLEGLSVRFRVNGDLSTVKIIKRELSQSFLTEVKAQTGLPLTVIGSPCSGAARFSNLNLKVRAQSNGQIHGETIVLRLINEDRTKNASIDSIGADQLFKSDIKKALGFNNGLILMCGQTGSGKSWTLYSLLMSLDRQTSKVITIEDPVEYEGSGLMQIEVKEGKVGFQEALRSSLRLDPDVIMVGEIRDEETAELAFKAASTGHLVFSTLHTNGAMEAITRLRGLGIAEDMIESNIRLISALTLKKQLCESCKIPINQEDANLFGEEVSALTHFGVQFFKRNEKGCSNPGCYQGATGRVLLYESVTQDQILELREGLIVPSFRSLKQCALERAASGIIGIEEAMYV